MKPFFVYLLRCADDSFYCGHTDNLEVRLMQHHEGAVGYTVTRKPVQLVWQGEFLTREEALAFEQQVKGWSRAKKLALIQGDWEAIKLLAKSRTAREMPFDKLRANGVGAQGEGCGAQGEGCGDQGEECGELGELHGAAGHPI